LKLCSEPGGEGEAQADTSAESQPSNTGHGTTQTDPAASERNVTSLGNQVPLAGPNTVPSSLPRILPKSSGGETRVVEPTSTGEAPKQSAEEVSSSTSPKRRKKNKKKTGTLGVSEEVDVSQPSPAQDVGTIANRVSKSVDQDSTTTPVLPTPAPQTPTTPTPNVSEDSKKSTHKTKTTSQRIALVRAKRKADWTLKSRRERQIKVSQRLAGGVS
jgi:hypothetical protein